MKKNGILFVLLGVFLLSFGVVSADEVSCGESFFLTISDSASYDSKTITLETVSSSSALVDVDGTAKLVTKGDTRQVGSLLITVDSIYARTDPTESGADLTITCLEKVDCNKGFTLHPDESVSYDAVTGSDRIITLNDVSSSSAVLSVDGITKIISKGRRALVNGLSLSVVSVHSATSRADSTATLSVACSSSTKAPELSGSLAWLWGLLALVVVAGAAYWLGTKKRRTKK